MKVVLIISLLISSFCLIAEGNSDKDYLVLVNGDTMYRKITQLQSEFVEIESYKANAKQGKRKIAADSIDLLYSKAYGKIFESHPIGKKKNEKLLIARIEEGELIIFCFLTKVSKPFTDGGLGLTFSFESAGTDFGKEAYFRHETESKSIIHKVNTEELNKIDNYKCWSLMQKMLHGLNEFDLSKSMREETFKNLVHKYNMECEAQKRVEEDERSNKR